MSVITARPLTAVPITARPLTAYALGAGDSVAFSPVDLFASGEQGAWYDPSDFSTMFQDSAGTTPVTAVGQSVGLHMDKSKGLALGPALVGAIFNSSISGLWAATPPSPNTTTLTRNGSSSGQASVTTVNAAPLLATQWYVATFTVSNFSGDSILFRIGGGKAIQIQGDGTKTVYSVGGGQATVVFAPWGGSAGEATITNIQVKTIAGNHRSQATTTKRPVLKLDGTNYYLEYDGVDDFLATAAVDFSATDAMTAFMGVQKVSDAARDVLFELGTDTSSVNATFALTAPSADAATGYGGVSRGTATASVATSGTAAPHTAVLTMQADISADSLSLTVNEAAAVTDATDQGTGNYGNLPVYFGARAGTSLFYNANEYQTIILGRAATAEEIVSAKAYVNEKTGAY